MAIRHEFIDQDYWDSLSPEERKYLIKFNNEHYWGRFSHDDSDNLIKSPDVKREVWRNRKARDRDAFADSRNRVAIQDLPQSTKKKLM